MNTSESQTAYVQTQVLEVQPTGFKKWLPLFILSMALLVIVLDTTILNVSLRTIIGDLGTTIQKIQWVITAYSLTLAALTITGGRLGDLFGRKKMFITGAIIFAIGSLITSISHSVGMMIAGEAIIEGIGAALMMPATSSLLVSNYKGRDRQLAFGVWGGIAAAAAALGPVVGGWLTTYYSWRWAFRINVIVVIALVFGALFIKEAFDKDEKPQIDFVGIILSALGLLAIVYGFIESSTYGWWFAKEVFMVGGFAVNLMGNLSVVVLAIIWGIVLICAFILWELYRERRGKTPLVSMSLFKNAQFTSGSFLTAIIMLGMSGMSFSLPVYYQAVKSLDAFHTGIAMLPMALSLLFAAPFSAYISKHLAPKRVVQIGLILDIIGFIVLNLSISVTSSLWAIAPGLIIFGAGMGFIISQTNNIAMSAVSVSQAGEASGVNGTLRTVGQTLGAAVLGAVLLSGISTNLIAGIKDSAVIPAQAKSQITESIGSQASNLEFGGATQVENKLPASISEEITSISKQATVDATHTTLWTAIIFIVVGLFVSIKLPNSKNIESEKSLVSVH